MSDIERLRVVATVARTHSISEAARVHGVAQSTVTRSVAKTEELVGFALFRRTAEGAPPTPAARPAIALIERIVSGFDELRALGGDRPASLRLAHRADLPIPTRLEDTIVLWNRENTPTVEPVILDDPVAAVHAGEAAFAVVRNTGPLRPDLDTVMVRVTRLERIELLHLPDPPTEAESFLLRV
ncbi:LysR family transcriptional regulator [Tsukamurella paurometabola]|uniref:HTH-type transcriptional regulator gltR n=2 Tax=Tsukamurella paurometabola TaxID=2061 RepID=A0A3P8JWS8_TSUPA|nr:LysR family transcriptional regulator [Tsukamurella paurometabola]UEA85180.1 LysR family transcriptional regulator [Tsukamurella paurometabola]VDR37789.1 HTH-type transcriptional regulator gltR [Tsukamurella paurometabola]